MNLYAMIRLANAPIPAGPVLGLSIYRAFLYPGGIKNRVMAISREVDPVHFAALNHEILKKRISPEANTVSRGNSIVRQPIFCPKIGVKISILLIFLFESIIDSNAYMACGSYK